MKPQKSDEHAIDQGKFDFAAVFTLAVLSIRVLFTMVYVPYYLEKIWITFEFYLQNSCGL